MNALYFNEHGDLSKLRYGHIPDPTPAAEEVVVKVKACAINHLDLWVLRGWPELELDMPHIGGADIAGEVAELGGDVTGWGIGTKVVVNPGFTTAEDEWTRKGEESLSPHYHIFGESRRGGFAEYVSVPSENLLVMPDGVSFVEAAAPQLVLLTAWRMLRHRAGLQHGETVLIVGAGGGVNSISIQLAKLMGASVIALTSSEEKMKKSKTLGADHVVNYRAYPEWSKRIKHLTHGRGVDVVVDNVGDNTINQSIRAVCRGGRIVTIGNTSGPDLRIDNRYIFTKQISIIGSTMGSNKDFSDAMETVWSKKIRPVIDRELPLKDGVEAYRILRDGEQFGKVVLIP